ncbi:ExeA family protein [Pseudogulbenkiania ferrooxidans]|uniref:Peptidoglycan-binding domain 1 protein n=1 Tax=Pseudogulbenkiania ferrooxidans 2002 TaxID=279714 RepID=B9Z6B6_9NEIS|nr:ExeA family protein [Pseudogulbenkiania ferrooxidans]EEG07760.1 Peptidoglycan-binding domain 1 protein [Pseudogulbenkiania ferrooxidans 2002]
MYTNHYGLADPPFSIAPDPRFLFMSQRHREALAHLMYGIGGDGGFVLLTGEIGTGKTTICRCFLQQLPDNCDVAFIFNPKLNVLELLSTICEELHIPAPPDHTSNKAFTDCINDHLLAAHAQGRTTLLIIDEAQNLDSDVLEQIRLLTNLETNQRKLLHIILLGQPELRDKLARPELQQLSQRIVARYHLGPLQPEEISAYVHHRLDVAGSRRALFSPSLSRLLFRLSGGIPRKLNILCDRALLGAYVQGKDEVDREILRQAAKEVYGQSAPRSWQKLVIGLGALLSATTLATALFYYAEPFAPNRPVPSRPGLKPSLTKHAAPATSSARAMGTDTSAVSTPAVIAQSAGPDGVSLAYRALLVRWGIRLPVDDEASTCLQAEAFGLHCLSESGDLAQLRRLDRPAVLQLRLPDGRTGYLLLSTLQNDHAVLMSGTQTFTLPVSALNQLWSGRYTLLWKAPPNYRAPLARGSRGLMVSWLNHQFGQPLEPLAATAKNPVFDARLEEQVMRFQRADGLPSDGIVGPHTLIRLTRNSDTTSPRLLGMTTKNPGMKG